MTVTGGITKLIYPIVAGLIMMCVEIFYMGNELENIRRKIPGRSTINTTATADHVPKIELHIRVIKEQERAI